MRNRHRNRSAAVMSALMLNALCLMASQAQLLDERGVSVQMADAMSSEGVFETDLNIALENRRELRRKLRTAEREVFPNRVAHYRFDVRVGNGPYDVIKIHRVVRERRPYRPVPTRGAVMLTHGSNLNFESIFLRAGAQAPAADTSVALYLASNDIDVWGIDFGWTQVPAQTVDFEFMREWGVERDASHTLRAMSIARFLRGITGQGFERIHLLGYSYGVAVTYAAAGRETTTPVWLRNIRGIIPVDGAMKYAHDDESSRLVACADAAAIAGQIASGVLNGSGGVTSALLNSLAIAAPNDPSPIFGGLTNYQAPLFFGANFYQLQVPIAPDWHFVAGEYDTGGLITGLLYSDPDRWIDFLGTLSAHMPNKARFETAATICDEENVSVDDYLGQISVPILYVGAGGGFGELGAYTGDLTASTDVTNRIVQLQDPSHRAIDYGHADLFLGESAAALAWEPIRQWLVDRSRSAGR